jgi:hypothetical protein
MAEDLTSYLSGVGVRVRYLHSDIHALDRIEILRDLRIGEFSTKGRKGGSSLCDVTSGKEIAEIPERVHSRMVAGKYLIGFTQDPKAETAPRKRDDHKAMARFLVVDLSDPTKPKVLSNRNLLGYPAPPADIIAKTYLSDFDPYEPNGRGTPSWFSLMGGPVPHGSRLLIQSTAFLYCIGEK